ncbi:hypothetical protein ADEAN_000739000 [Angomonas deanei]|uniref:EF-hand domain-containing protein n=1 Tax=Angomonas deanei TaxID=59799 RepID=A0A7G2CLE1_9TRYP|nr:hypothetical protein ADEAN_000739000 [Angomonas deanei]
MLNPDAAEQRAAQQQEEERKRLSEAAAAAADVKNAKTKTKKKATKKKADASKSSGPAAPLPGEPPLNLRIFMNTFLPLADEEGLISVDDIMSVFKETPFDVVHTEAVHSFFQLIRQVSVAKMNFSNTNLNGSTTSPMLPSTRVGFQSSLTTNNNNNNNFNNSMTRLSNNNNTTRKTLLSPNHFNASQTYPHRASGGESRKYSDQANNNNNNNDDTIANNHNVSYAPRILVRELLAGLDALLNAEDTAPVLRWECYHLFSADGNGLLQKQQLENIRRFRRGEANLVYSASMIKSLSDAFEVLAKEEEEAYEKQNGGKKKKKKKATTLPPNQTSIIPPNVRRVSHMDFKTFTRLFEVLPQLAASFARVWLPLLMAGEILPSQSSLPPNEDETNNNNNNNNNENENEIDKNKQLEEEEDEELLRMQYARSGRPHPLSELGDTTEERERVLQRVVQDRVGAIRTAIERRQSVNENNNNENEENEEEGEK